MSDISSWTTSANGNNFTPPDGWPEGMAPSAVNDTARENMAAIRRFYVDSEWINWGHVLVRQTNNSFLISSTVTQVYPAGRRLRLMDAGVTLAAEVIASSPSGANTLVTVSCTTNLDSSLSSGGVSHLNPLMPSAFAQIMGQIDQLSVTAANALGTDTFAFWSVASARAKKIVINNGTLRPASAAEAKDASLTNVVMTPFNVVNHPGVAKAWGFFRGITSVSSIVSYNIKSIVRTGAGSYAVSLSSSITNGFYAVVGNAMHNGQNVLKVLTSLSAGGFVLVTFLSNTAAANDSDGVSFAVYGNVP